MRYLQFMFFLKKMYKYIICLLVYIMLSTPFPLAYGKAGENPNSRGKYAVKKNNAKRWIVEKCFVYLQYIQTQQALHLLQ